MWRGNVQLGISFVVAEVRGRLARIGKLKSY